MAHDSARVRRIEIAARREHRDPRGEGVADTLRRFLGIDVRAVRTRDVYKLDFEISEAELERFVAELSDPVLQVGALDRIASAPGDRFDYAVEVAYKPGVTDPVGKSARIAIEDTLGRRLPREAQVYTSTLYLLEGVDRAEADRVALELLANPVIQTTEIAAFSEWCAAPPDTRVPKVRAHAEPRAVPVDLSGSDADLERISRERLLALTLAEMREIRDHFRRAADDPARRALGLGEAPTDVELECIAQTWSEHCKHKIFNATITHHEPGREPERIQSLFKTFIRGTTEAVARARGADGFLISVFHDNAGVVAFDEEHHLVYKVETHNSPSALDPYGGAITGIVGVNRDPFGTGLGADLLSNVWGYCFAAPDHEGELPKGLLHPRRIRDGVHHGVIDGGNQSGIPYARGWELFDARFLGKPLVFCGTVGRLPVTIAGRPGHEKGARPGDKIVMVGGRIGADGIHGATFSSAALDESAPIQAVQIGDPITQKRMFDFLTEARELGLYSAITDNGAGGLSSSVGEMATSSGGARLDLSLAPLKYAGLAPWEILTSEAQERMTLAVPPDQVEELLALSNRREVESTVLGEFTESGQLVVDYAERTVARISLEFLHEGAPDLNLTARWSPPAFAEPDDTPPADLGAALVELTARLNIAPDETTARHYDHEVKGLSVVKPFVGVRRDVPAEATVLLVRHGSRRGYVLSEGVNPLLSDLDAYWMAKSVVDLAIRRQLCAGAQLDRIALLDNFCWPDPVEAPSNPDGSQKLAQLVRACRGLHEAAVAYGAPLVSGKDSMKNDSTMGGVRISVPPTLLVSAIGQIDDATRALTLGFERPGDVVYLLGTTHDELGGSEWYRLRGERAGRRAELGAPAPFVGKNPPKLDTEQTLPLYRALAEAFERGQLRSASTPALGGLALSLVRSALAGDLGVELDLDRAANLAALPADVALFSESNGRFVVSVAEPDAAELERSFAGLACARVGRVTESRRLVIAHGGRTVVDTGLDELRRAFGRRAS